MKKRDKGFKLAKISNLVPSLRETLQKFHETPECHRVIQDSEIFDIMKSVNIEDDLLYRSKENLLEKSYEKDTLNSYNDMNFYDRVFENENSSVIVSYDTQDYIPAPLEESGKKFSSSLDLSKKVSLGDKDYHSSTLSLAAGTEVFHFIFVLHLIPALTNILPLIRTEIGQPNLARS